MAGGRDFEIIKRLRPEPLTEREKECLEKLDIVDYEIFRHKMELIILEAKEAFTKIGAAPAIRAGDVSVGIYTAQGDLSMSAPGVWIHSVLQQIPIKYALKHWMKDPTVGVKDGDIFFNNEHMYGGVHPPDMLVFMPLFYKGELIGWTGAMAHEGECGATEPGGLPPSAKSRYDEGMHLPPLKIGENFQLKSDIVTMMENMVRDPRMHTLDIKARVGACMRVRKRAMALVERWGLDLFTAGLRQMLIETEKAARRKLRQFNDGTFRMPIFIDSIGAQDQLYRVFLSLTKKDDHLIVDFSGTSPEQWDTPYNSMIHLVIGMLACYLFSYVFYDLPANAGVLEPFEFRAPEGCLLNAWPELGSCLGAWSAASMFAGAHISFSKMVFDSDNRTLASAAYYSSPSMPFWGGTNQWGLPIATIASELNAGGCGARSNRDGVDTGGPFFANMADCEDVETNELQSPILTFFRNHHCDGHGFGKYRGGSGVDVAFVVHNVPHLFIGSIGSGGKFPAANGLFGGYATPSTPGVSITNGGELLEKLIKAGKELVLNTWEITKNKSIKGTYKVESISRVTRLTQRGEILFHPVGGGGGYGDVLERDPEAVIEDIKKGLTSPWAAENVYHVAYDEKTMKVDHEATKKKRQEERRKRIERGMNFEDFERQWSKKKPRQEILKYYGSWPDAKPEQTLGPRPRGM